MRDKKRLLLASLGTAVLALGFCLPWMEKNRVTVSFFERHYMSMSLFLYIPAVVLALLIWIPKMQHRRGGLWIAGCISLFQTSLLCWDAYKLNAIGSGLYALFFGTALIFVAAMIRPEKIPTDA